MRWYLGIVFITFWGASLGVCQGEYGPPAVLNCSSTVVSVTLHRADGKMVTVSVNPSAALLQPLPNTEIVAISSPRIRYAQSELSHFRQQRHVSGELWIISAAGLDLVPFKELRSRRKSCES